ncbi:MAG: NYN domain-containing protein [Caldimonas sp.]
MFFIDADNVAVEVIEQALADKQALHGPIHVKRCYCSADFALKNLAFLKKHSIRPMVNATAGKNCTDIALAIDAVQLCEGDAPAVVVIVGSDSDFAPLVMHLRDRGCRVEGVGQEGKVGAESHLAYDDFTTLPVGRGRAARAPAAAPRRTARAPAPSVAPAGRIPAVPGDVVRWLDAIPGLASGDRIELKVAAEALRKEKMLSRNASSTSLFKKHPDWFELAPARQPNSVRFRGIAGAQ